MAGSLISREWMQKIVHRALKRNGRNDYFFRSAIFISSSGLMTGAVMARNQNSRPALQPCACLDRALEVEPLASFSASLVSAIRLSTSAQGRITLNENHLLAAFGAFQCRSHAMSPIQPPHN